MHDPNVDYHINKLPVNWVKIFYSNNTSKIQAVNADMEKIEWQWDIVVLVSDDMVPQVKGYDEIIRSRMPADTDGIVWVNDGTQGQSLNTISILGRKVYNSMGYIYHPDYKSLFCDTEFTDLCKGPLASKTTYVEQILIRHEHPGTGFPERMDELYNRNQRFWSTDMETYISRKNYAYDWSILIPTLVERIASFDKLMKSIDERRARICPNLRIEFCVSRDNREKSVGMKRQELLQGAKGKYMSFVDDDDDVTDAYFEDALACITGAFHVARLRGQISDYTFTHSLDNTLQSPLVVGDVFMRPPNHLNVMMTDIARFVPFKDATQGEDLDWTIRLSQSGFLKNEYRSDESRIHYIYQLGNRKVDPQTIEFQKNNSYEKMLQMVWTPAGPQIPSNIPNPKRNGFRLTGRGFVSK